MSILSMDNDDYDKEGYYDLLIMRKTYSSLIFTLVAIPLYTIYFIIIVPGFILGVLLSPFWIGVHIIVAIFKLIWFLAKKEERIYEKYLYISLPKLSIFKPNSYIATKQLSAFYRNRKTWKRMLYFSLKPFLSIILSLPAIVFMGFLITLIYAPINSVFGKIQFYNWYETESYIEVVFIYFIGFNLAVGILHAMLYFIKQSSKITRSLLSR